MFDLRLGIVFMTVIASAALPQIESEDKDGMRRGRKDYALGVSPPE
ncbi:MAG: hypothetical protein M3O66_03910 [Verrucomicrobiota bacterium]|nr:hypothetical protein [Verrucomicrobiota bacterium]